ncbi:MAG TPA: tRNA dihydrouridine(20/20a) synthase DusA [Gammaproteobacteria bacterium]|nr:tRNA dihydrouridine(20/20a) synthase DusA [Gammaproteobacteria bacterium]
MALENKAISVPVSIAPMMGYTDRHARYLHRLISPHSLLYTEMLTAQALMHDNADHLLQFDSCEHPVALQLGGSDPEQMAQAARTGADAGYDEININIGCPSDRVQSGAFGACLMATPGLVAQIFAAMQDAIDIPVTVKHRIGIDDQDSYEDLDRFVGTLAEAGCMTFVIHARKAWLKGLSPKQNRDIPPLDYERVYKLKQDYPQLRIIINGGIKTAAQVNCHLAHTDGVMIGREAFNQPWLLAELESVLFRDADEVLSRRMVQQSYAKYMQEELKKGTSVHVLVRPLSGLFHGLPGARNWRRMLSGDAQKTTGSMDDLVTLVAEY